MEAKIIYWCLWIIIGFRLMSAGLVIGKHTEETETKDYSNVEYRIGAFIVQLIFALVCWRLLVHIQ